MSGIDIDYHVSNLESYPQDGKHQIIRWELPIEITKGMDGFSYYNHKGEEKFYNERKRDKSPIDQRWIAFFDSTTFDFATIDSEDLNRLLHKVVHKDLTKVLTHCIKVYKKVLEAELKYLNLPLTDDVIETNPSKRFKDEFKIN